MTNYTLSPVWGAGAQLLTNNATPLSGGKIYVYEAGTTTPAVTYTDPFGVVPNTNPIVANAAGRLASEIWFPVGASFKFVLKDATDVLIATYDNIPSVPQPPFSNEATGISYSTPYLVSASAFTAGVTYTIAFVGTTDFTLIGATSNTVGVTFTASGPGTGTGTAYYTRTIQSKLQDTVSVKDFRAVGDGVTDDTAAIQAALAALSATGGDLLFPQGTYKINTAISQVFSDNVNVRLLGYGAKLDVTAITSGVAITLGGVLGAGTPLASNVAKNSATFVVSSTGSITEGRIVLIRSTDLWNPISPQYVKGELVLVEDMAGTTVTNTTFLYDGYTAATTTVYLLDAPCVTVEGFEIVANADITGLLLKYVRNPIVRACKVHGARYSGVTLDYFFGGLVDGNFIYDSWNGLITGTSYGLTIGTGQSCKVTGNTIYGARHSITGGGFEPSRDLVFANNACFNSTREDIIGSIDLHGNTELCVITGNTAASITISGIDTVISNNTLHTAETSVPGINVFQTINSNYYTIHGNNITCAGSSAFGIFFSPAVSNVVTTNLTVSDNVVSSVVQALFFEPRFVGATGTSITYCLVSNNVLRSANSQGFALSKKGATTMAITTLLSSGNTYQSAAFDAFFTENSVTYIKSVGDTFFGNRASGYLAWFGGVDVHLTAPLFRGNVGGAGASRSVYYANTGRIDVLNPEYSGVNEKAEIGAATTYAESGWYAATPTILNTSGAKLVNFYGSLGRAITYGAAAPTTNTWAIGDRVYNLTPAGGQPKSWVCTVAGTPGTWVSEGNL